MSDTLYLQLDQNIQVTHPHIYLQDIAKLSCSNSKILNRLRVMPVANLAPDKPGRYVMSVMDLITEIQKKEPDLEINTIGEENFIITFKNKPGPGIIWQWCKIIFVGLATFFGAGFSIMTFNADVSVDQVFGDLHRLMTGQERTAITWLEGGYAAGLFLGILSFYNHFRTKKRVMDPTPLEVEMREYERTVNQSILDQNERIKSKQKRRGERV